MRAFTRSMGVATAFLLAVALVAGCGSDTPGPKPTISDASTTPAGYDATVVPERPADVNTADGAVTFAEYAALVLYYTQATFDPEPLASIANMDTCLVCNNLVAAASDPHGAYEIRVPTTEPVLTVASGANYIEGDGSYGMVITVAPLTYECFPLPDRQQTDDKVTTSETIRINVMWRDGRWQLQGIGLQSEFE